MFISLLVTGMNEPLHIFFCAVTLWFGRNKLEVKKKNFKKKLLTSRCMDYLE